MDILLDTDGDLLVNDRGDIEMAESLAQKVRIRVLWFLGEWRWDPDLGLPYFDELFDKDPNISAFRDALEEAIYEIDEVTDVDDVEISFDSKTRKATISYQVTTDYETIQSEVEVDERLRGY